MSHFVSRNRLKEDS